MEFFKVSSSPHMKHEDTTASIMLDVLIGLVPALIFGVYYFGTRALTLTLISVVSCMAFEYLYRKIMKKSNTLGDLSAVVTGVLLTFCMPHTVPLWMPVVGAFFAIVIVKQLYGGLGKNVVNPALAARVFLFACFPGHFGTYSTQKLGFIESAADAVASATPLVYLKNGEIPLFSDGSPLTFGQLAYGYHGGCIGEVSAVLLVCGGFYLLLRRVITWHIPVSFLGTVALLSFVFPVGSFQRLDFMICELVTGGLVLGAIFMATDYVTCPATGKGRIIYGIGCGVITVFIRYFGGYPEGASFAILIMNLFVWYIDKATMPRVFGMGGKNNGKAK